MGFVFIEANVKKWGLAPMTGSLAPPPPYGSEQGSILLEGGREGVREGQAYVHGRTHSASVRLGRQATSPGPRRSPTEISLAQLSLSESREDIGEGTSYTTAGHVSEDALTMPPHADAPPPEYESPDEENQFSTPRPSMHSEHSRLLPHDPPIPSYEAAVGERATEFRDNDN